MLRKFIFKNNVTGKEVVLPITPESFTIDHGNHIETVNLHTVGDYHLPSGRTLFTCKISGMLPRQQYPFVFAGSSLNPYEYIYFFELTSDKKQVCRFAISDTPTIADVYIENFQYGEKDGTNDVYYTITLRRHMPVKAVQSTDSTSSEITNTRTTPLNIATPQQYTIQRGDTLWSLCKKFYGDPLLYPKLAKANNIPNPDLIYDGNILIIPDKNSL
mgnify:CR=1 FL=1